MVLRDREKYFNDLQTDVGSDSSRLWNINNEMRSNGRVAIVLLIKGVLTDNWGLVANALAHYFETVYVKGSQDDSEEVGKWLKVSGQPSVSQLGAIKLFTVDLIWEALGRLKTKTSVGSDGLPRNLIKFCKQELLYPFTVIFNIIDKRGISPSEWKKRRICSIYKGKGKRQLVGDYRPVTALCALSKVWELCVYDLLMVNLKSQIATQQHGFPPGRSTVTNLMVLTEYIHETFSTLNHWSRGNVKYIYRIGDINLSVIKAEKDLGVVLDVALSFVPYINTMVSSSLRILGFVLRAGRYFSNLKILKMMYKALVLLKLEYALPLRCTEYLKNRIELVQRRFLKHSIWKGEEVYPPRGVDNDHLLDKTGFCSLPRRRQLVIAAFCLNIIKGYIDCPVLLGKLNINVPLVRGRRVVTPLRSRVMRRRFYLSRPLVKMSMVIQELHRESTQNQNVNINVDRKENKKDNIDFMVTASKLASSRLQIPIPE